MNGRKIIVILAMLAVVLVGLTDCAKRRGGSRGGGNRSSSRSGSSRRSSSRQSSTRKTRRSFSPAGTSRVTKYTPIPVYTSKSPVIVRQTKSGSRSNLGRNVFVGYMFYRYSLYGAPVYRQRYPLHRSTVEIPDERAVRVNFTKEIMLDPNGNVCTNSSSNFTIAPDKNGQVVSVLTSVKYSNLNGGRTKEYFGDNQTVSIDMNALDQSVEISTVVTYNGSIVANTNCTQIKSVMNGTVVRMYATNPDSAVSIQSCFFAMLLSSIFSLVL